MSKQRVLVLAGGLSHERDVSLRSGRRVSGALEAAGVEVTVRDADSGLLTALRQERPDCVVPMLHGEAGEDGSLQEVLELAGVPYVGSGPSSSRAAFAKPVAKHIVSGAGLATPDSIALAASTFREIGATTLLAALVDRLGLPLFVKPAEGGSALGCSAVSSADELPAAMVTCFAYGSVALIEKRVLGVEVAVSVIDTGDGPRALPAVEVRPDRGVYDYSARYTAGATEFVVPAELTTAATVECARVALGAHRSLRLRDVSRTDLIVDGSGTAWFLEANVAPGMTETSLVPLSVDAAGMELGQLFEALCIAAVHRSSFIDK